MRSQRSKTSHGRWLPSQREELVSTDSISFEIFQNRNRIHEAQNLPTCALPDSVQSYRVSQPNEDVIIRGRREWFALVDV